MRLVLLGGSSVTPVAGDTVQVMMLIKGYFGMTTPTPRQRSRRLAYGGNRFFFSFFFRPGRIVFTTGKQRRQGQKDEEKFVVHYLDTLP